jgi:putative restriction endonuclease
MSLDSLHKYIHLWGSLHRNRNPRWGGAPHKPILLLAILDMIERGEVSANRIALTPELAAAFRDYWRTLVAADTWQERIVLPFRFMVQEGFWELVKEGVPVAKEALGMHPTIRQMTTETDGARLAPDLWALLQDRSAINALRTFLLSHYFDRGVADVRPVLHTNPIDYEAERLKAEAQSRFRPRHVREDRDETGVYLRHALFPKVVKSLYNHTCAVCGLNVRTDAGSGLVDAAHIMPFGQFHNDDPRNGIALCKNHHWGFDAGWFTAALDYKILVSPHLQNTLTYLTSGTILLIPAQQEYAPASEALAWHHQNVYQR